MTRVPLRSPEDAGRCPACGLVLPPIRPREVTCSDACHAVWIEQLVARLGETTAITHFETGKTYLVPTRVILEQGIRGADLRQFPEKRRE